MISSNFFLTRKRIFRWFWNLVLGPSMIEVWLWKDGWKKHRWIIWKFFQFGSVSVTYRWTTWQRILSKRSLSILDKLHMWLLIHWSHKVEVVRVRVLFDINIPLKNTRVLQTPTGEMVDIGIEYERIQKRWYQCQRLTHDKDCCPLNTSNRQAITTGGVKATSIPNRLIPKNSKDDPLFGVLTDDDVGIDSIYGKPKIAKAVLDEMHQYLSMIDPQERKVRVERVRRSVWDLDGDLHGQRTLLCLELQQNLQQTWTRERDWFLFRELRFKSSGWGTTFKWGCSICENRNSFFSIIIVSLRYVCLCGTTWLWFYGIQT